MKTKLFYVVGLILITQMATAQRFGLKGGVNFANMTISAMGMGVSPKSLTGFHAGFVGDFQIKESFFFNSGILYSLKGFKIDSDGETGSENINYLVVPLNMAYKFPIKDNSKFLIQAGPYLGYALNGKSKSGGESSDIEFGSGGMNRLDYGVGFGAGIEFGSVTATLNYELGLANLVDDPSSETKLKNKVIQISLSYMFGTTK